MDAGKLFGRGIAFPPRIGDDGRMAWSEGPQNIRESIRIILLTEQGERLMRPDFGGGLKPFLFEPNTAATRRLIQERIQTSLRRWEPRIKLATVTVEPDPNDPETAVATITYQVVANQSRERTSVTVPLAQARR